MADSTPFVLTATVIGEAKSGNSRPVTRAFSITSLKQFARSAKNATIAIAVFDDNGKMIGFDVTGGMPSPAMRKLMDEEFGDDPQGVATG